MTPRFLLTAATLTALAGVPRTGTKPLDGRDLSPLLRQDRGVPWPERLIFSQQNANISARSQRYRLDSRGALFDLVEDPGQARNVAAAHPEIAAQMARAVEIGRAHV